MSADITAPSELDPETLARLPSILTPTVSPDGTDLAFYHDQTGRMELYVTPTAGGEWTQISDSNVPRNPSGGIAWGPDGEWIYFHRDEAGDEQNDIHRISRAGETESVVEPDGQAFLFDITADGTVVYVADAGQQLNLYSYDPAADDTTQLTSFEQPVQPTGSGFGPADRRLAFVANESADLANKDVYVTSRDGSDTRRLAIGTEGAEALVADWFPDGERLLIGDNSTDAERVGVYRLPDDEIRWLSAGETVEEPAAVAPDGRRVVTTRTRRAATVPVVYDLEADTSRELDLPEGVTSPIGGRETAFVDETTVVVGHTTGDSRREIVVYDLSSDEGRTLIDAEYGGVDPSLFVSPEYVRYESDDGLEIGALLYEPPGGGRSAVVKVHGGPPSQSKRGFDTFTQFLVSQGHTVLEPNYRGSTGRGREFRNRIDGDWGGMEQVDVRCGAAWLADRPGIDEDRIAVFGGSYGGYSAYCQLTMHPEPWAAGVAWIGMTDLLSLYEESMPHFRSALERYLGDPEDNEAFYRERSPITHVENVDSPLAILHGVNDPRCPISQARQFRDALEAAGRSQPEEFEYTELGEEGHGSIDQDQKLRAFELLADFLERRL